MSKTIRKLEAVCAKDGELEKELATFCDICKPDEKIIQGLELQVIYDAKSIAHLATILKHLRSIYCCLTAKNGELRGKVHAMGGKTL